MEKLLTFAEAEQQGLGSRYTLARWARLGKLPVVKLGKRSLRLRPSDLEAFIRANTQPAREAGR